MDIIPNNLIMEVLPDEIIMHIMVLVGLPDINKTQLCLKKTSYDNIMNALLDFIICKSVKIYNSNHILIEINPRRKISLITDQKEEIRKTIKKNFIENEADKNSFHNWIKKYYLKNNKKIFKNIKLNTL